tara:strand:+ start:67 stop:483 length:417 start_codon:yes stop_codon:yes gene_type:complete
MKIWKRDIDLININKKMDNTLASHLGIKITKIDDNSLQGEMVIKDYLKQPYGILHGGASVSLAETLGSLASNLCIEEGINTVGLDINANHIRAVRKGLLKGKSIPIHLGKSTHVWEIKMYDGEKITCISRLTMAILRT